MTDLDPPPRRMMPERLAALSASMPPSRAPWHDKLEASEFTLRDRFAIFGGVLAYAAGFRDEDTIPRHIINIQFAAQTFGPARPLLYLPAALFYCFVRPDL